MDFTSYLRQSNRLFYVIGAISLVGLTILEFTNSFLTNFFSYMVQYNRYQSVLGIGVILLISALFSYDRTKINIKLVLSGLSLHFFIALFVLKSTIGQEIIGYIADGIKSLYGASEAGISFLFGPLSVVNKPSDFIFAVKVLPVIIFFGALMSLLFYLGIVQKLVSGLAYLLRPLLGTSGAETLCAVANSFLGQTEAPLLIRSYLHKMTRSEFLLVMISGMGSISGAILAIYAGMGVPAKHLLAASVMSIPASIVIAKILYPETDSQQTSTGAATVNNTSTASNVFDAISHGTSDGLSLALNVGAMLVAFISLLFVINSILSFSVLKINSAFGLSLPNLTLDIIFGWICMPFGWLLGLNGQEAFVAGELIGIKVAVNELVAYSKLVTTDLSARTISIITYALCGFSNFSCIGIQLGGIGALVPEKRAWLSEFGLITVLGGALSNLLSAMVANILI